MADIIRLEPRLRAGAADGPGSGHSATIVIFPGVRYEKRRDEGDEAAARPAPRRRKSRKVN